jgi:antitoxin component YwqK of YwqJK toxin-antitoxin module
MLNKEGQLGQPIAIKGETAEMVSAYPNGKTAMSLNLVKGSFDGKMTISAENGNPEYESTYDNGLLSGTRAEYFSNGKAYKKEQFVHGNYSGRQEYFSEDGLIRLSAEYKNDELHGNTILYNKGVVATTKKYDSDQLVDIIK